LAQRTARPKTAIFWLLTAVLAVSVNLYFAGHRMYRNESGEIDANYRRLTAALDHASATGSRATIVLGNSYTASALITGMPFADDVGRFSTGGLPLLAAVSIVERLPDDAPAGLLIVGLGYNYANPVDGGLRMHMPYWSRDPVTKLWYSLPAVRSGDAASKMLKDTLSQLSTLSAGNPDSGSRSAGESPAELGSEAHRKHVVQNARTRYDEYVPFTSGVSGRLGDLVERLKRECDRRGIALVTFTAPIYHGVRDRLDPAFLVSFRRTVADAGVAYVDFNEVFPDWDESYFNDATHVSVKGRKILREEIESLVRRTYPDHAPAFR
jgi:hypothetical protein